MDFSFLRAAEERPDEVALVVEGVAHRYGALAPAVRRTIAWLAERGIDGKDPGARVGVVGGLRLETVVAVWALAEIGAPIVLLHPRLTEAERTRLIEDSTPRLVIDCEWTVPADGPEPAIGPALPDDERCLAILYTSGTTGRSKGAILSRRAFAAAADASQENIGWEEGDRWLLCMPIAHVGGLSIVLRCLRARKTVVLAPAASFSAEGICRQLVDDRVTLLSVVPTMLKKMFDLPEWRAPEHLRCILLGGAAASASILWEAGKRGLPVLTTYGMTEACSQITSQRRGTKPSPAQGAGVPLRGVEVRIVEDRIQVRGPNLMSGYFPPGAHPPAFTQDGWFDSGDLGLLDEEGHLHILARRKDLIITGGENVYPVEVEQTLETHPGIAQACVFGVPDDTWGQIVVAAIAPRGDTPPDSTLVSFFQERLAKHKRPRQVAFLDAFPTTHSGKVDRAATQRAASAKLRAIR